MSDTIVNRVERSGILTVEPDAFLPKEEPIGLDIAPWLWQGLALKEKDFRESMEQHDWSVYAGKAVAVFCSAEAIIPTWAYMLVAAHLEPHASHIHFGTVLTLRQQILLDNIAQLDIAPFADKRVVIKGCGDNTVPTAAYLLLTEKLKPVVRALMFGEPCSTVPVFRKPRS